MNDPKKDELPIVENSGIIDATIVTPDSSTESFASCGSDAFYLFGGDIVEYFDDRGITELVEANPIVLGGTVPAALHTEPLYPLIAPDQPNSVPRRFRRRP